MKRFTSLVLLLLCAVTTLWAAATDLPEVSTDETIKWYTIKNVRKQKYATYAGDNATMTQQTSVSAAAFFYFTASTTEGAVKIHNYSAGNKLCAGYNSWTETGRDWYLKAQSTGVSICTSTGEWDAWNDAGGGGQKVEYWSASDAGSAWEIELVTDFTSVIDVPAAKTAAIATLDNIKNITVLFNDDKIEEVKTAVNNVEAISNSLEDLNAAIESINAIVATVYTENFTTKNVRFTTDARGNGVDITAVDAGAAEQHNSGDAGIWTLKAVNGGFKMYNFVSNLWMGATKGQSQRIPTVANEEDAALYVVNSNDGNKINLMNNGNTLHANGWGNIVQWNDNSAGASIFLVAAEPEITVARDVYVNANAAKATLPYAIQQAYGLVTDAKQYYSNWKSTAEGSYEALLDNKIDTYFHSAYTDEAKAEEAETHYIQADLGEGNSVGAFYFYMKPRSGNGNNRPIDITVYGSNDLDGEFAQIAQVKTTLDDSMTPYMSPKLGDEIAKYRYIRLTVTSTNTNTKFFTLSELYFFPATEDVTRLATAYINLASTSITSKDYANYANTLINAESTLALANIKKEIAAILTTNATNHAEEPALGQYTTAAYNALTAANADANATQESLEAAIAAFNKAKNLPVFTIDGVISYAAGKSVYDDNDGAPNFKATNKYDKTMWWVFDQAETTVGITESVDVVNYATGNGFWGAKSLKVAETSDANGNDGIFLFYTVGNGTPLHYQDANQVIVRWDSKDSGSGSATKFSYLGNTYDLDKLTDEKITALTALQVAYDSKALYASAVIGEGLGQYQGDKDAIVTALVAAEAIGSLTLAQQVNLNVSDINTAATALNNVAGLTLNMPEAGKYYYLKNGDAYLSCNKGGNDGTLAVTSEAGAANIFYYEKENETTYLFSYHNGCYIANPWHIGVGEAIIQNTEIYKQPKTFVEGQVGKYALKYGNVNYIIRNGNATYFSNTHLNENGQWTLEEVEALPVTISAAKYATFYAPVAVTVPEGVTAYIASINEGGWVDLDEIGAKIPANTGVVLAGEMGAYDFAITTTEATVASDLRGSAATTYYTEAGTYYALGQVDGVVGFYKDAFNNNRFQNNSHKAYLYVANASDAASFSFRFGEGTTSISEVKGENGNVKTVFDLTGRRVEAITAPGIYIINGKKTLVK